MTAEPVVFSVSGVRYPTTYDRSDIRLGSAVHVEYTAAGEPVRFFPKPSPIAVPHFVTWISPSEWYVTLKRRFEVDKRTARQIGLCVEGHLSPHEVERAVSAINDSVDPAKMYMTDELRKWPLGAIAAVAQRLELCDRLSEAKVGKVLFHHWQPLVEYLYLTCFDVLGQTTEWCGFEEWLRSRKTRTERDRAMSALAESDGPVETALKLHGAYQSAYGVRRSFVRFIRKVLPADSCRRLLDSVRIERQHNPPDFGDATVEPRSAAVEYLFETRNTYTHRAQFVGGVHDRLSPASLGEPAQRWTLRKQTFREDHWESVYVRNWPAELRVAIQVGLATVLGRMAGLGPPPSLPEEEYSTKSSAPQSFEMLWFLEG